MLMRSHDCWRGPSESTVTVLVSRISIMCMSMERILEKNFWVIVDRRVAVWVIHKDLQTLSDFGAPMIKIASNFFGFGIQTAVCLNFEHTEDDIEMISARISHESHDWHRS